MIHIYLQCGLRDHLCIDRRACRAVPFLDRGRAARSHAQSLRDPFKARGGGRGHRLQLCDQQAVRF